MGNGLLFFIIIIIFFIFSNESANSSCPVDLSYVHTYPWDKSSCLSLDLNRSDCCIIIRSLIGMALAQNLRDTSLFQFPNASVSSACLSELQGELTGLSINPSIVSTCYPDPNLFSSNASNCVGIITTGDWKKLLGPTTALDSGCKNFSGFSQCGSCVEAGNSVYSQLVRSHLNTTKCYYFVVLYAAGILNDLKNEASVSCLFRLLVSSSNTKNPSGNNRSIKLIIGLVGSFVGFLLASVLIILYRKWNKKRKQNASHEEFVSNFQNSVLPNAGAKWFHLSELEQATDGFSQLNLLGQGASGVVYKGTLEDRTLVAVKQILDLDIKGDEEFTNEVEIISKIRHRNLLSLRGCCVTSDDSNGKRRFLVYDYMPNGTLDDHVSNTTARKQLTWPQRKNIILDVARGIAYLHYGLKPSIYHRDIKSTNILLDSALKAKVADFGLAKQTLEGQSHQTTRVAGTFGYIAPEYALYGQLTEKSDVYSFGMVILELMSGRKVLDTSTTPFQLITDWAWGLAKSEKVDEIFDEFIREEGPGAVMERFVLVGILCAHTVVDFRPTITDALKMLEGDIDIPTLPDRRLPDKALPVSDESFRSLTSWYDLSISTDRSIPSSSAMSTISIV